MAKSQSSGPQAGAGLRAEGTQAVKTSMKPLGEEALDGGASAGVGKKRIQLEPCSNCGSRSGWWQNEMARCCYTEEGEDFDYRVEHYYKRCFCIECDSELKGRARPRLKA